MGYNSIYSIGHSTRKQEEFLALLNTYGIRYLADVRSRPYSKYNPQYNREAFSAFLQENGLRYVYMGHLLGGRPEDSSCYTDGRVNYEIVNTKVFYLAGIERLKTAYEKQIPLAIMCSESKPENCHRSRLISNTLSLHNIAVQHIDEHGALKSHRDLLAGLVNDIPPANLFDM